jgi:CheY-like chemotaxis protein
MDGLEELQGQLETLGRADLVTRVMQLRQGTASLERIVLDLRAGHAADGLHPSRCDVADGVRAAARIAGCALHPLARVTVTLPAEPVFAAIDATRLTQLLLDLLLVAARALAGGTSETGVVSIAATATADAVIVAVEHNGAGLTAAGRSHALAPSLDERAGSSVGLWLCKAIVAAAGGTLALADGAYGGGVRAEITLPRAAGASAPPPALTGGALVPAPGGERLRVLIVDDEPLVARTFARALRNSHDVDVETSPARALERIEAGARYDLIVSDLTMPELDGMAFLLAAETLDVELAGRMLLVTGGTSVETWEAIATYNLPTVEKPVEPSVLRRIVAGVRRRPDR